MLHQFYTLDTPTPLVAGYDLISAAKLVIDSVRECIWTYWFIDSSEPHTQNRVPDRAISVHTLTAPSPTTLIRPADQWLDDCFNLVGIDAATVGYDSTLQSPDAPPSSDSHGPGPSAPHLVWAPVPLYLVWAPEPLYVVRAPAPPYRIRAPVPPYRIQAPVPP